MTTSTANVSSMPTDWWTLHQYAFVPLGICDDFDDADEKAAVKYPGNSWIVDRAELGDMRKEIQGELHATAHVAADGPAIWWTFHEGFFKRVGEFADFEAASIKANELHPGNLWTLERTTLDFLFGGIVEELDFNPASPQNKPH